MYESRFVYGFMIPVGRPKCNEKPKFLAQKTKQKRLQRTGVFPGRQITDDG
jgi:hypothetical protein